MPGGLLIELSDDFDKNVPEYVLGESVAEQVSFQHQMSSSLEKFTFSMKVRQSL